MSPARHWFCNYPSEAVAIDCARKLNALSATGNEVMNCAFLFYSTGPAMPFPGMTEMDRESFAGLYTQPKG